MIRRSSLAVLLGTLALAAPAQAAPPANDGPAAAAEFATFTAENGTPTERQAIAELVEATGDAGVPRCLGDASFDRTVWFRVPAGSAVRELQVEASGRTTAVLDLAAWVQPAGATAPVTVEPNACAGAGAGGAEASEEPTAGVVLRVPAGRTVLVQVGRRGTRGSAEDERAVVSLGVREITPAMPSPAGDVADAATPVLGAGVTQVPLGGATLTEEDPAQPPCPSIGSVWRRVVPDATGTRNVTATGPQVGTLAVFAGERPTGENVLGCVNRERTEGALALSVPVTRGVPLWIRIGTDRPPAGSTGTVAIDAGPPVGGGGPGGGGATPPGAAPAASRCPALGRAPRPARRDTRVRFAATAGSASTRNRSRRIVLRLTRLSGRARSGRVVLVGPCRRVYARSAFGPLRTGRRITLTRLPGRPLVRGTYRLQVDLRTSGRGPRTYIPTSGSFRLR